MAQQLDLSIRIAADGRAAAGEIERVERELRRLRPSAEQSSQALARMSTVAKGLGAAAAAVATGAMANSFVQANLAADKLRASLETVTGSTEAATVAWNQLVKFAEETPYTLDQSVEGFIKLQALGLDPSIDAMRSYGNTASAMGKDMMQMVEAVADASVGEFERLKEFGIKASKQGDQVALTFQGNTEVIGNSADEITQYLLDIGNTEFAGGMDRQMDTLGGAFSNLEDSIGSFWTSVGDAGARDALADSLRSVSATIGEITKSINDFDFESTLAPWSNAFSGLAGAIGGVTTALAAKHAALLSVTVAQGAFNAVVRMNPYVAVAASIGAAAGVLYNMRDAMIEVGGVTGTVGDYIKAVWGEIKSAGSGLWSDLSQMAQNFGQDVYHTADAIISTFDITFSDIAAFAKDAVNSVINGFVNSGQALARIAGQIYESFKNAFQGIGQLADGLWKSITNFDASHIKNAIANNAAAGFTSGWSDAIGDVKGYLTEHHDYVGQIAEGTASTLERVQDRFQDISLNRQLDEAIADEKALNDESQRLGVTLDDLDKPLDNLGKGLGNAGGAAKKAAEDVNHLQKALEKQANGVDGLISQYLPARAAQEELTDSVRKAAAAYALGKLSASEYETIIAGVHEAHDKAQVSAGAATESMASLWKGAVESIGSDIQSKLADAFEGLFSGALDSAKDFFSDLGDIFKRSLAQLAASVMQQKIVVPIMASLMPGTAAAGGMLGQATGGAGGLGGLGGLGSIGKMLGSNSIGESVAGLFNTGGIASGATYSTNAFSSQSMMLAAQESGMAASQGFMSGFGNGLASTPNWAFGAGGIGGSLLGSMLFDGEYVGLASSIGSTAGSAIGSGLAGALAVTGPIG
ncbi:MAG: tape measure protein, partial [Halochromatium sp.]